MARLEFELLKNLPEKVAAKLAESSATLEKPSKVLEPHEGKILKGLQYDRMRVNPETGELGGPEYSFLSHISDPHREARAVAAVSNKSAASRYVNQYKDLPPGSVIHTPMLGSDIQHRGNPSNFGYYHQELLNKVNEGEIPLDRIQDLNDKLNSKVVIRNKKLQPLFPDPVDVLDPAFANQVKTFDQRTYFADALHGQEMGGVKGRFLDIMPRLQETVDPYIADAPPYAFGHRIVQLEPNVIHDPTLHGDYPFSITGEDLGVRMKPIPSDLMEDFHKFIQEEKKRKATPIDFRSGDVSQQISPEWLQKLKDEGFAKGGKVDLEKQMKLDDIIPIPTEGSYGTFSDVPLNPVDYLQATPASMANAAKTTTLKEKLDAIRDMAGESIKEDVQSLNKPRAASDIANSWAANMVGFPVDLANMALSPVGLGSKEPFLGSEYLKHKMVDYGLHTGTERPWIDTATSFINPASATRGIAKGVGATAEELARQVQTGEGLIGRNVMNPRTNILPERGINFGVDFTRPSEDTIMTHKMESMPGNQWHSWLQSNAPKSSKKELETAGTMDWLKDNKDKVSKTDIINHVRENEPNLRSKTYTEYPDSPYEVYGGGEDGYHVVNTSMSDKPISSHETQGEAYAALNELESDLYPKPQYEKWTLPGKATDYREIVIQDKPKLSNESNKFESSHYPEATNPIAHLRVNHRTDVEGNPTLFVEELQSDWAQRGKKVGFDKQALPTDMSADELLNKYRDRMTQSQKSYLSNFLGRWEAVSAYNNIPEQELKLDKLTKEYQDWTKNQSIGLESGPYVKDTKDWTALSLKQAIKEAVDHGQTQVAWTNGTQQADRYDLSKHIYSVKLMPDTLKEGQLKLVAYDHDANRVINEPVTEKNLDEHIGKDLANKLLSAESKDGVRQLEGLDIKTEHKGMQGYYDNIVPQVANDILKQLGSKEKVQPIRIKTKNFAEGSGWNYRRIIDDTTGNVNVVDKKGDVVKTFNGPSYMENRNKAMQWQQENDPSLFNEQMGFKITPEMIKHIKEKGIPKFAKGGPIDLEQQFKLDNIIEVPTTRRRYG